MVVNSQDIIAFLNQMPSEMKQEAIKHMETLRGVSINEYKNQRIESAESLLADAQENPDNYTVDMLDGKYNELLRGFKISDELDRRFGLVKWFITERSLGRDS